MAAALNIVVLAGGPDAERDVSQVSGRAVAEALQQSGHMVELWDALPEDMRGLDRAASWPADVVFPVLHGKWGEGGALQELMDQRGLVYVGSGAEASSLCMDKWAAKQVLAEHGLPSPEAVCIEDAEALPAMEPPAVVKAVDEGSSLGLHICHDRAAMHRAADALLQRYPRVLIERYVRGAELTVGLLGRADAPGLAPLPAIQIVPAGGFYDYQAKYADDAGTAYRFETDLAAELIEQARELAERAGRVAGVRHLARVDFLIDAEHRPWILELNTMPGFTAHSLLPMAAERAGLPLAELAEHLVRLALAQAARR